MEPLFDNLVQIFEALVSLVFTLGGLLLPWLPLIAWIGYWTFAVDWVKLRRTLLAGGWIGVVLIGLVMILVWGTVAPPDGGRHSILGLSLSNFVGKTVYVTTLFVIMFLCGSVQLSGCCGTLCCFPADEPVELHAHAHVDHGHDAHGDHGHGSHDHGGH